MNCRRADRLIAGYLHGELPPRDRELLEEHLVACERCRLECEGDRALFERVGDSLRQPPEDLVPNTMAAVRAIAAEVGGPASVGHATRVVAPPRSGWAWLPRPAIAAALVGIVVIAATVLWLLRPQQPSVQAPIGVTPQVVQDDPGAEPPEEPSPGPPRDSDEAPREPEGADGARSGTGAQPPSREGAGAEGAPHEVGPDEATPRPRRPQSDAWRPGRIAEETGRTDTRGGPPERPVDVRRPTSYGRVASVAGEATIRREGREGWRSVVLADALQPGDVLRTGADSSLVAEFGDASSIELAANTEIVLGESSRTAERPVDAELTVGDIVASIKSGGGSFEVETSIATAGVVGTKFALEATSKKTVLTVLEGAVSLRNDLGAVTAQAMEQSVAALGHAPTEPFRVVGRRWGQAHAIFGGKWTLNEGGHIWVDTTTYTKADIGRARSRLATQPEEPAVLAECLAPLWWDCGGISLSLECAVQLARRPEPLTALRRAQLGVVLKLSKEEGTPGWPVFAVLEDSPAHEAGLREEDLILSVNGAPAETELDVLDQLWRAGSFLDIELRVLREGVEHTIELQGDPGEPGSQDLALLAAVRLLRIDPEHRAARMTLANAQACAGDLADARKTYRELLAEQPDDPVAMNNLGVLEVLEGNLGEGFSALDRAVTLAPDFEGALLNLASLSAMANLSSRERSLLERAHPRHPEWERTAAFLARAYSFHRDVPDRVAKLRALSERYPDSRSVLRYLALALENEPDLRHELRDVCERGIALGGDAELYLLLADYCLEGEEAIRTIETMVRTLVPQGRPFMFVQASNYYRRHGMPKLALEAMARGARLDPANTTGAGGYMLYFAAGHYGGAGRHEEALACSLKAARLEPTFAGPWGGAAAAAKALGDTAAARKYWLKALEIGTRYPHHSLDNPNAALGAAIAGCPTDLVEVDQAWLERFEALALQAAGNAWMLVGDRTDDPYGAVVRYCEKRGDWEALKEACMAALFEGQSGPAADGAVAVAKSRLPATDWLDLLLRILSVAPDGPTDRRLGDALRLFGQSVDLTPGFGELALERLGPLSTQLGDASYAQAALAAVHLKQSDTEEAARQLAAASTGRAGDTAYYWLLRARVEDAAGHADGAINAALHAAQCATAKDAPDLYIEIADFLAERDPEAGLETFAAKCDGASSSPALALIRLSVAPQEWERLDAAVEALVAGEDDDALDRAAMLLSGLGRPAEAMALMERAIRIDPLNTDGDWGRSYRAWDVFSAAGETPRLLKLYEAQFTGGPDDRHIPLKTAELCLRTDDRARSKHWLERADTLHRQEAPPSAYIASLWVSWHKSGGDVAGLMGAYQRVLEGAGPEWDDRAKAQWDEEAREGLIRLSRLGGATGPVNTLCGWIREESSAEAAATALDVALAAGANGRPLMGAAEVLAGLADEEPGRVGEWAERLVAEHPGDPAALLALAEALKGADRDEAQRLRKQACEGLRKIVATEPQSDVPWLGLYQMTKADHPDEALRAALGAVARATPDSSPEAYSDVAQFLAEHDPLAGLQAFAARYEEADGAAGPLAMGLIKLSVAAGDEARLQETLDAMLEGDDARPAEEAAVALSDLGRHEEAVALMEHAVRLDPLHWDGTRVYERAAPVLKAAGELDRLIAVYEKEAARQPESGSCAYAVYWLYDRQADNSTKGVQWLERAHELDPRNTYLDVELLWRYREVGRLADSMAAARRALANPPQPGSVETVERELARMEALGEATEPVDCLATWVQDEVGTLAKSPVSLAMWAAEEHHPLTAVAFTLSSLEAHAPERCGEWAERLVAEYPDNAAAVLALVAARTDAYQGRRNDPPAFATEAIAAVEEWDSDLRARVYVACGELLLDTGTPEEAREAFERALAEPGLAPVWKTRAEQGLQRATDASAPADGSVTEGKEDAP